MALEFYCNWTKGFETKSQKVLMANSYFWRSCRGKTGRGGRGREKALSFLPELDNPSKRNRFIPNFLHPQTSPFFPRFAKISTASISSSHRIMGNLPFRCPNQRFLCFWPSKKMMTNVCVDFLTILLTRNFILTVEKTEMKKCQRQMTKFELRQILEKKKNNHRTLLKNPNGLKPCYLNLKPCNPRCPGGCNFLFYFKIDLKI